MRLLVFFPLVTLSQNIQNELQPEFISISEEDKEILKEHFDQAEKLEVADDSDDENDPIDLHMAEFEDIDQALRRVNIDYDSICGRPTIEPHGDLFFDLPLNPLSVESLESGLDIDRIVGGTEAVPHSWPWQAKVKICSRWRCTKLCGGSIVSSSYVVTAAHCIPPRGYTGLITVGDHDIEDLDKKNENQDFSYRKTYRIMKVLSHRHWNKRSRYNDIALLKTSSPINFNDGVKPICLPDNDVCINDHTACVVTGWGKTGEKEDTSAVLQEVAVRTLPNDMCSRKLIYDSNVNAEKQICAGFVEGGKDSCSGDSGGPLVCKSSEKGPWMLYGIVSWGYGCARKNKPGVYVRVSSYVSWIEHAIRISRGGNNQIGKLSGADNVCLTCGNIGDQCDPEIVGTYSSDTMPEVTLPPRTTTTTPTTVPTTTTSTTTTEKPKPWEQNFQNDNAQVTEDSSDQGYTYTDTCGNGIRLTDEKGGIKSQNFGERYPKNTRCKWIIGKSGPQEWNQVNVQFNDLDLSKTCGRNGDKLVLKCKKKTAIYCSGRVTGGDYDEPLFECDSEITIEFTSDSSDMGDGTGFKLLYRHRPEAELNKCGQLAEISIESSDPFSRHNWEAWPIKPNWDCRFTVQCPAGQRVTAVVDQNKTFLSAREKLQRSKKNRKAKKNRYVPVTCYDKMTLFGGSKWQTEVCGKRSLTPTKIIRTGLSRGSIRLQSDKRFNIQERVAVKFSC